MKFPKYHNADICKDPILSDNQNKSGIYMWTNLINDKRYVGSSENLKIRFSQYFNVNYLKRNNNLYICRALLKHDYSNFSLEILEYCEPDKCLIREKHYISLYKPEYNIVQDPTLNPMSGRQHSEKTKQIMSDAAKERENSGCFKTGENNPNYGKKVKGSGSPSQAIEVTDIKNDTTITYDSMGEAARALNINISQISKYFSRNQKKPYKGQYTFRKVN